MSGGGFQVDLPDLERMAGVFRRESLNFSDIMPAGGPPCPDGGPGEINTAMDAAVQLLGLLHQQMATVIGGQASKLQAAHDNYENADASAAQQASALTGTGSG